MSIEVCYESRGDYVLATCAGQFDPDDGRQVIRGVFQEAARLGCEKALLDCREVTGEPSILQRFDLATYLAGLYVQQASVLWLKLAVVGRHPLISRDKFGETVARNRGMPVNVTVDYAEALEWLGVSEEPESLGEG